jgi:hypothetical protein
LQQLLAWPADVFDPCGMNTEIHLLLTILQIDNSALCSFCSHCKKSQHSQLSPGLSKFSCDLPP